MEEFQYWLDKLTKKEKTWFVILIGFIVLSSFLYLFYRSKVIGIGFYFLAIGILVLAIGAYYGRSLFARNLKTGYLYGDTRSNSEYYENNNLRDLDNEVQIQKPSKKVSRICYFCQNTELLPYTCKFCGNSFCSNHRIPEKHNCKGIQ